MQDSIDTDSLDASSPSLPPPRSDMEAASLLAAVAAAAPPLMICRRLRIGNLTLIFVVACMMYLYYLHRLMRRQIHDQAVMARNMRTEARENLHVIQEACLDTINRRFRAFEERQAIFASQREDAEGGGFDFDAEDELREEDEIRNMLFNLEVIEEDEEQEAKGTVLIEEEHAEDVKDAEHAEDIPRAPDADAAQADASEASETQGGIDTVREASGVPSAESHETTSPDDDVAELKALKHKDLKQKATSLGLDGKGTKETLIQSIIKQLNTATLLLP